MSLLDRLKGTVVAPAPTKTLAERLGATPSSAPPAPEPERRSSLAMKRGAPTWSTGAKNTADFKRILALPRRKIEDSTADLTEIFAKPGGKLRLRAIQSAALREAPKVGGMLGPIAVGGGKTLTMLLLPRAMGAKRPVFLVKPDLKDQLIRKDWPFYAEHFHLPQNALIISYSQLSTANSADVLDRLCPDLIVADECHCLKARSAARTKRFLRYMEEHTETRFCGLSGSITSRSVREYAHLAKLALRDGSPLPLNWSDLEEWALALDPQPEGFEDPTPGALQLFCEPGESVRAGFRRRLVETPGVVASGDAGEGMSLRLRGLDLKLPLEVDQALKDLRQRWVTPGGEELEDAMALARSAKQLSQGFYYVWDWADITPDGKPDREWLDARAKWHRAIRNILKDREGPGLDSPLLVARAAGRGELEADELDAWAGWCEVSGRQKPPTLAVWLSDFLVDDAPKRIKAGIIWYEHKAVGRRIAEKHGLPLFEGGNDSSAILETKEPLIVASIRAHGTGKNLQRYSQGLILSVPASGDTNQQLLGRMHRPGQLADEVIFDIYQHEESLVNSLAKAISEAGYMQATTGATQKILLASKEDLDAALKRS